MLFNSYAFIIFFWPVIICMYYIIRRKKNLRFIKLFLLVASYIFIVYSSVTGFFVLIISSLFNYTCNKVMLSRRTLAKRMLLLGIAFNITILGYYKYTNFIVDGLNLSIGSNFPVLKGILPLGISFYTFQQIAFLVDNYRGEVGNCGILDYFLFIAYFPKIVQGPITYHNELLPQFQSKVKTSFNSDQFASGLMLFAIGLAKKVLIADNFAKIVDYGYNNIPSLNSFEAILVIVGYTFQIYFDFSGYCDMAVGISKMLNIELPLNFNSPYKALNINDFWKRWHITLTRFLTKYIYIPLGGNRKGKFRTYVNIFIVFLISGIWHGAGVNFIVWGVLHGIASIIYRIVREPYGKLSKAVQWCITFIFINISWTFFRAANTKDAILLLTRVFNGGYGVNIELKTSLLQPTIIALIARIVPFDIAIILLPIVFIIVVSFFKNTNEVVQSFKPTPLNWLITYVLLVLSILSLSGVSTFLYSNF